MAGLLFMLSAHLAIDPLCARIRYTTRIGLSEARQPFLLCAQPLCPDSDKHARRSLGHVCTHICGSVANITSYGSHNSYGYAPIHGEAWNRTVWCVYRRKRTTGIHKLFFHRDKTGSSGAHMHTHQAKRH